MNDITVPDTVTQAIAAFADPDWAWSIADLDAAEACDLDNRRHDLDNRRHDLEDTLGRLVPKDEKIPARVWLGLSSTGTSDAMWVLAVVQDGHLNPPTLDNTAEVLYAAIARAGNAAFAATNDPDAHYAMRAACIRALIDALRVQP